MVTCYRSTSNRCEVSCMFAIESILSAFGGHVCLEHICLERAVCCLIARRGAWIFLLNLVLCYLKSCLYLSDRVNES